MTGGLSRMDSLEKVKEKEENYCRRWMWIAGAIWITETK